MSTSDRLHERMTAKALARWQYQIEELAEDKGLWRLLSGDEEIVEEPAPKDYDLFLDDENNPCERPNARRNGKVGFIEEFGRYQKSRLRVEDAHTLLAQNCDEAACFAIRKITSPSEAYEKLCDVCCHRGHLDELRRLELSHYNDNIVEFVEALEQVRQYLADDGWEKSDQDMICIIVRGLTPDYRPLVTMYENSAFGEKWTLSQFKDRLFSFKGIKPASALLDACRAMAARALVEQQGHTSRKPTVSKKRHRSEFTEQGSDKDIQVAPKKQRRRPGSHDRAECHDERSTSSDSPYKAPYNPPSPEFVRVYVPASEQMAQILQETSSGEESDSESLKAWRPGAKYTTSSSDENDESTSEEEDDKSPSEE